MRTGGKIIVANWKMNPATLAEARSLFRAVSRIPLPPRVSVVYALPFPYLADLSRAARPRVSFAAQDVFPGSAGSHTGEVSAPMAASVGASSVLVGHSERRLLGESDDLVAQKTRAALAAGLTAVLCVGERERDAHGGHISFLDGQLRSALANVPRAHLARLVVAYEPLWAIGKSAEHAMKPHDVHQVVVLVRRSLAALFGKPAAARVRVLYGGSVEAENAGSIVRDGEVDGLLVGHASLEPGTFRGVINSVGAALRKRS